MNKDKIKRFFKIFSLIAYSLLGVAMCYYGFKGDEPIGKSILVTIVYIVGVNRLLKVWDIRRPSGELLSLQITLPNWSDVLKSIICFVGMVGVMILGDRYLPDTTLSAIILTVPLVVLFICGAYFLSRRR